MRLSRGRGRLGSGSGRGSKDKKALNRRAASEHGSPQSPGGFRVPKLSAAGGSEREGLSLPPALFLVLYSLSRPAIEGLFLSFASNHQHPLNLPAALLAQNFQGEFLESKPTALKRAPHIVLAVRKPSVHLKSVVARLAVP